MTELKVGTFSENEEVEEYEETKAPQEKDYSIYKEYKVIKLLFGDETDSKKRKDIKSHLLKTNPGLIIGDIKQTFNTTTKKMDSELCDLIIVLDSKDKMENLQQKITDFYTYDNLRVNDPKSVSGGKRIDIEEHSAKDNKEVKLKFLTIYFYRKENKVMIQGSNINLEIFIENYLYQFTRSLHTNNFVSTNNQSEQFSNELDTIDSSQVVSSNANEVYIIPETNDNSIQKDDDNISELSDESLSVITESDLKCLERKFCLKIKELEQIIKAQHENYKDMETQYQNKAKLQIKEFENELIKQQG